METIPSVTGKFNVLVLFSFSRKSNQRTCLIMSLHVFRWTENE